MKKTTATLLLFFVSIHFCKSQIIPAPRTDKVPVLRYHKASVNKHFYTVDRNELGSGSGGWVYEGYLGWLENAPINGTAVAVYRYYNSHTDSHYYSTGGAPSGFFLEGLMGYQTFPIIVIGHAISVYEYYNNSTKNYIYVTNPSSENLTGYVYKRIAFSVWRFPDETW